MGNNKSKNFVAEVPNGTETKEELDDKVKGHKTFRKYKTLKRGSKYETLGYTLRATLGAVPDVKDAVVLPEGEDFNEWLAVNTVYFYNAASLIYGTCSEFCTEDSCSPMRVHTYEFLWADGHKIKKPMKVSAPQYISLLFDWIDEQVSDESIFPQDEGGKFPKNFHDLVKNIFKRMFRMYGHIYYSHFANIREGGAEAHLNSCFKHFMFFVLEFDLINPKQMAIMRKIITRLHIPADLPQE